MTSAEIMGSIGLKDRKSFSELYLNAALSEKAIERKYPNTPRHPRQQYLMTELEKNGKEWYEKKNKEQNNKKRKTKYSSYLKECLLA